MKRGYLSEYFVGVAGKRLSAVEADPTRSHQHEYNATKEMLSYLGRPTGKVRIPTLFLYLTDDDPEPIIEDGFLTLGNRREGKPRSPEYRLYFPTTTVSMNAAEGDLLVIAKKQDGTLLVIIAENGSSISRQIQWLFGFSNLEHPGFSVKSELETEQDRIEFASRFILESIGIEVETSEDTFLDDMLSRFGTNFPPTKDFSAYARSTLKDISSTDNPDTVLMAWMEREEILFRTMERYLIADRLSQGFNEDAKKRVDVDGFLNFSLKVQNRRKSRVGLAFEHHLEVIFKGNNLEFQRSAVTENRSKPDFLFPGAVQYHNPSFDYSKLTMLGVKSTCKDRWRQVLSEADRILIKHLITLETAISKHQTDEMVSKRLQLIVPESLQHTYLPEQRAQLMNLDNFIEFVSIKQRS